jgi:hypothetical protein
MRYMNDWEIDDAVERHRHHPILGPATQTLHNLAACADANSDGWAYWPKPARAAAKLMELIEGDPTDRFAERDDVTKAQLKAAYRPIRSFLTRHKLTCEIIEPKEQP